VNESVYITCALTGAGNTVGKSPLVPVTPKQIAEAGLEAASAGAAVLHIHVRKPESGAPSRRLELYAEVVERIRERNDTVILNLTGGMGGDLIPGDKDPLQAKPGSDVVGPRLRMEHIQKLRPEIASLDCGSMNFGETVYITTPSYLREMARMIREAGAKPELEVFEMGHVRLARWLISEGLIDEPPLFQLCLGIPWAAEASTHGMNALHDMLPENVIWAGFGIGRMQMPMVAQAVLLGGNVRVGLEDNLYLEKGRLASNAELVERAVKIIELLGSRVLAPNEVRAKLGLRRP